MRDLMPRLQLVEMDDDKPKDEPPASYRDKIADPVARAIYDIQYPPENDRLLACWPDDDE